MRGDSKGLTLIESLVALAILGIAAVAVLPAFMTQLRANTRSEVRSGAVSAVQEQMESLRLEDPASLPSSGASAPQLVNIGDRQYEVITRYCVRSEFCDVGSRHLIVEVYFESRKVYDVETVYTQLL